MVDTMALPRLQHTATAERAPRPARLRAARRLLELQSAAPRRGAVALAVGADPVHPDAHGWFAGAVDELRVAGMLDRLGGGWRILNDVPAGAIGDDIDHLLIGPAGVLAITLMHLEGRRVRLDDDRLTVDGTRVRPMSGPLFRPPLERRADAEARLGVALGRSVAVTAVIVLVGVPHLTRRGHQPVPVLTTDELEHLLRRLAERESPRGLGGSDEIASTAADAGIWRTELESAAESRLVERVERLREQVRSARRRRAGLLTVVGGIAASAAVAAVVGPAHGAVQAIVESLVG